MSVDELKVLGEGHDAGVGQLEVLDAAAALKGLDPLDEGLHHQPHRLKDVRLEPIALCGGNTHRRVRAPVTKLSSLDHTGGKEKPNSNKR